MSAALSADRYVLGGVLLLAALTVESWSGQRALAYLAGAVGIVAIHERLRFEFPATVALLASVLAFAATSVFWSMTRSTSSAEATVFAAVALLAMWASRVPAVRKRQFGWSLIAVLPIAAGLLAPGPLETSRQTATGADLLFSSRTGLLSLTPVVYVAVIGTLLSLRRQPAAAAAALVVLGIWVVARAALHPISGSEPFGHGLTPAIALTAPGLAYLLDRGRERPFLAVAPLVLAAILWNYWMMVQYTSGALPKDEPVSFGAMVRQQADVHTRSPYWYPFAFPANAWFAWRERVPIDRYELLSDLPVERAFDLVMDRSADRFLLEGWSGIAAAPSGPVRWTTARRSTILFPLAPASSPLTIEIVGSARVEDPPVAAAIAVEINGTEVGRLSALPESGDLRLIVPAAEVGRIVRAGYNRLGIVFHGIHRLDPLDPRPPGPLAARSAVAPYPVAIHRIRIAPAS
jgi:hypothetical protein